MRATDASNSFRSSFRTYRLTCAFAACSATHSRSLISRSTTSPSDTNSSVFGPGDTAMRSSSARNAKSDDCVRSRICATTILASAGRPSSHSDRARPAHPGALARGHFLQDEVVAAVDRVRLADADVMEAADRIRLADDLGQGGLDERMVCREVDVRPRARQDVQAHAIRRREPVDEPRGRLERPTRAELRDVALIDDDHDLPAAAFAFVAAVRRTGRRCGRAPAG